jgi:bloom syndrome protein
VITDIAQLIRNRKGQTGIVYCLSKKDTEAMSNALKVEIPEMKSQITHYHAEVDNDEKERRQRSWSKGNIKVICATIAFGMGINKPDVRYVIHHSLPKSLTNFYQV